MLRRGRWLWLTTACATLVACNSADIDSRQLPTVGPFAAIESVTLGTTAERVLQVRERAVRAPMGGVREQMGDWMLHYDLPTPRVDTLFGTMRVRELSALRGAADSASAERLQDSLLTVIRASGESFASTTARCVRAARGVDSVTWIVIGDNSRELALGYWQSRTGESVDSSNVRDSSARRFVPPLTLALTLRAAGEPRAWERDVECPASARD